MWPLYGVSGWQPLVATSRTALLLHLHIGFIFNIWSCLLVLISWILHKADLFLLKEFPPTESTLFYMLSLTVKDNTFLGKNDSHPHPQVELFSLDSSE